MKKIKFFGFDMDYTLAGEIAYIIVLLQTVMIFKTNA